LTLGGRMRNLVGSMANEKLTRVVISQLQVLKLKFRYYNKVSKTWLVANDYTINHAPEIRSIQWSLKSDKKRQIIYNLTVSIVVRLIPIL